MGTDFLTMVLGAEPDFMGMAQIFDLRGMLKGACGPNQRVHYISLKHSKIGSVTLTTKELYYDRARYRTHSGL